MRRFSQGKRVARVPFKGQKGISTEKWERSYSKPHRFRTSPARKADETKRKRSCPIEGTVSPRRCRIIPLGRDERRKSCTSSRGILPPSSSQGSNTGRRNRDQRACARSERRPRAGTEQPARPFRRSSACKRKEAGLLASRRERRGVHAVALRICRHAGSPHPASKPRGRSLEAGTRQPLRDRCQEEGAARRAAPVGRRARGGKAQNAADKSERGAERSLRATRAAIHRKPRCKT